MPWRQALCPGERPGARPFAHSGALRARNQASLGISPGQSPIWRRLAGAKSHFGAFRQGVRHAQGRCPGARRFALTSALAQGPLPIPRSSARAITHLLAVRPGNRPFGGVSPGQNPISGHFAWASAMPRGDALATGPLPWRKPWRKDLCPFGGAPAAQPPISWHFARAITHSETFRLGKIPFRGVSPGRAPCAGAMPWRKPWRKALCPFGGAPPAQSPNSWHFARAITHSETFRRGEIPFRGVSPGRATCAWATPWRKALCPVGCPRARHYAQSGALRRGMRRSVGCWRGQ
jgi:hypothetical protein